MESPQVDQVVQLLNFMLNKESLRRNVYLFNALTPQLTLPLRVLAKERRIANITQDPAILAKALSRCPHAKMSGPQEVTLLVPGDQLLVRLSSSQKVTRKELSVLTKQMKVQVREEKRNFLLEFQSHAAAEEFLERAKVQQPDYQCQLLEKDPYRCLQQAIAAHRRQKKVEKEHVNECMQSYYYAQQYLMQLSMSYPTFVRRGVNSDEEEDSNECSLEEEGGRPKGREAGESMSRAK